MLVSYRVDPMGPETGILRIDLVIIQRISTKMLFIRLAGSLYVRVGNDLAAPDRHAAKGLLHLGVDGAPLVDTGLANAEIVVLVETQITTAAEHLLLRLCSAFLAQAIVCSG